MNLECWPTKTSSFRAQIRFLDHVLVAKKGPYMEHTILNFHAF